MSNEIEIPMNEEQFNQRLEFYVKAFSRRIGIEDANYRTVDELMEMIKGTPRYSIIVNLIRTYYEWYPLSIAKIFHNHEDTKIPFPTEKEFALHSSIVKRDEAIAEFDAFIAIGR